VEFTLREKRICQPRWRCRGGTSTPPLMEKSSFNRKRKRGHASKLHREGGGGQNGRSVAGHAVEQLKEKRADITASSLSALLMYLLVW
jgi:hypothetical protein